jgi:hypothetical protein
VSVSVRIIYQIASMLHARHDIGAIPETDNLEDDPSGDEGNSKNK